MNLTIDIGNTSVKILIFNDTQPIYRDVVKRLKPSQINHLLRSFPIKHSILSTVIRLEKPLVKILQKLPQFEKFSSSTAIPLKNLYKTPKTLGYDRLANAIAGSFLFPGKNVLVIDAGTCIKYDFINSAKEYLGGSISPGFEMRFKAMHQFTGKLPLIKEFNVKGLIGTSTISAMQTGVMIGIYEEVKGFIQRYKKEYPALKIILTGGDAFRFAGELKLSIFAAEDLVNIGLNEIIRYHSGKHLQK